MTLSTHVLDLSMGVPAAGIEVALYRLDGSARTELARAMTNADGRVSAPFGGELAPGEYELEFSAGAYFRADALYDRIPVRFRMNSERHYHVPLLLSPWGYSTYRGS